MTEPKIINIEDRDFYKNVLCGDGRYYYYLLGYAEMLSEASDGLGENYEYFVRQFGKMFKEICKIFREEKYGIEEIRDFIKKRKYVLDTYYLFGHFKHFEKMESFHHEKTTDEEIIEFLKKEIINEYDDDDYEANYIFRNL